MKVDERGVSRLSMLGRFLTAIAGVGAVTDVSPIVMGAGCDTVTVDPRSSQESSPPTCEPEGIELAPGSDGFIVGFFGSIPVDGVVPLRNGALGGIVPCVVGAASPKREQSQFFSRTLQNARDPGLSDRTFIRELAAAQK